MSCGSNPFSSFGSYRSLTSRSRALCCVVSLSLFGTRAWLPTCRERDLWLYNAEASFRSFPCVEGTTLLTLTPSSSYGGKRRRYGNMSISPLTIPVQHHFLKMVWLACSALLRQSYDWVSGSKIILVHERLLISLEGFSTSYNIPDLKNLSLDCRWSDRFGRQK